MQYKIPLQIENEDSIFLGLSLRQLAIIMGWGGIAYGLFKMLEPRIGGTGSLVIAWLLVTIGIVIALIRIAEMTFLPTVLNTIRMHLNNKLRAWSQWTDSYPEIEIGFVTQSDVKKLEQANQTYAEKVQNNDEFADKLKNL